MPRLFDITTPTNTIVLDKARRGEASFTVTNISGQPRRARLLLVPEDSHTNAWLSLQGEPVRAFVVSETQQLTVNIQAPPRAPSGIYGFRLDLAREDLPDEDLTQGPRLTFQVPEAEPKPAFPLWVIPVVLGAIAVVGGVIAFLVLRPRTAGPEAIEAPAATAEPSVDTPMPLTTSMPPDPILSRTDRISGLLSFRGVPLPGVAVVLMQSPECNLDFKIDLTRTDSQGVYHFLGVSAGSYTIAFNGWSGSDIPVEPYLQDCTWELEKSAASALTLDWSTKKTDLRIRFPADAASISDSRPTFSWEPYPDAVRYEVVLIQTSPTRETIEFGTPATGTQFTSAMALSSGAEYWLLIWAWDTNDQIAVGQVQFTISGG